MFKVVCFNRRSTDCDTVFLRKAPTVENEQKLANNFSRARSMVLQYALCNPWDYFFTGTLDSRKFDRFDLDTFAGRLSQWIRDKRKSYNAKFQVLLVPERHEDGAWHIHGLVYGLPDKVLCRFSPPAPKKLIDGGFFNWPDYMEKFGFCSLAPIKDPVATAFYITKYISKDLSRRAGDLGKHLYFHSRPLAKAEKVSDVYYRNSELEDFCVRDYDFCKTGMVENAAWYFPYIWDGADFAMDDLFPQVVDPDIPQFDPQMVEPPAEVWEQLALAGH